MRRVSLFQLVMGSTGIKCPNSGSNHNDDGPNRAWLVDCTSGANSRARNTCPRTHKRSTQVQGPSSRTRSTPYAVQQLSSRIFPKIYPPHAGVNKVANTCSALSTRGGAQQRETEHQELEGASTGIRHDTAVARTRRRLCNPEIENRTLPVQGRLTSRTILKAVE